MDFSFGRIDNLKEVLNSVENFATRVDVQYTPLEKSRLESLFAHKQELEGSDYYSRLAQNAIECARGAKNPYLKKLLMERAANYTELSLKRKTKASPYLALDGASKLTFRDIEYYKTINARARKLIESIADKATESICERVITREIVIQKMIAKQIKNRIYNLVMLALLLQICVGDNFMTILPPNYFRSYKI